MQLSMERRCYAQNLQSPLAIYDSPKLMHTRLRLIACALCCMFLSGCSNFRVKPRMEYVYGLKASFPLRDRISVVNNKTATVKNGERLRVLERERHNLRVQTESGEQGWIDDHSVATQATFDGFEKLGRDHHLDIPVATGVLRDEAALHLTPGRNTERFYLFEESDKVKLLERASLPRAVVPGATAPKKAPDMPAKRGAAPPAPEPPPMDDWWLVRDAQGHTGWLLSRMLDVDAPDALTRYAEGQKFVGAYVLTTVYDPDAEQTDKNIPIYLTVLAPYKYGLPYDFDQVRVFTWSLKKHRYETAFRESKVEGFLPVTIGKQIEEKKSATAALGSTLPKFSYKVLAADAAPVYVDPESGIAKPGRLIQKTFVLEGNYVRRVSIPGEPANQPLAHPQEDAPKKGEKKRK